MRIFLDMDEVLVDFIGGACEAWGVTKEQVLQHWTPGHWDMVPPLAAALGHPEPMTQEEFWEQINGSEEFWTNLDPLPWACRTLDLVGRYTEDWYIVSAPSRCNSSYSGKVKYLKKFFNSDFDRFILTPYKNLFAVGDSILIDDRDSNVLAFTAAGGKGIVFPRHHNSKHKMTSDPVREVANQLKEIAHAL